MVIILRVGSHTAGWGEGVGQAWGSQWVEGRPAGPRDWLCPISWPGWWAQECLLYSKALFYFIFGRTVWFCRILASPPMTEPGPWQSKHCVLTTGLPIRHIFCFIDISWCMLYYTTIPTKNVLFLRISQTKMSKTCLQQITDSTERHSIRP